MMDEFPDAVDVGAPLLGPSHVAIPAAMFQALYQSHLRILAIEKAHGQSLETLLDGLDTEEPLPEAEPELQEPSSLGEEAVYNGQTWRGLAPSSLYARDLHGVPEEPIDDGPIPATDEEGTAGSSD